MAETDNSRSGCVIMAIASFLIAVPAAGAENHAPRPISVNLAVRQIIDTAGYPSTVLTKGKHVIASITPNAEGGDAGLEVFRLSSSSGNYEPSCGHLLTFPAADNVASVMGMKFLNKRRTRIAVAVECAGAEIAYLPSPASCAFQTTPIRVPQPSVANCQGKDPPGTFDLAVSPKFQFAFLANEYGTLAVNPSGQDPDGTVGIIRIQDAGNPGYSVYVPGGSTIAGVTISGDGKRLYVTNENSTTDPLCGSEGSIPCNNPTGLPVLLGSELVKEDGCYQRVRTGAGAANGLLTVYDVEKLKQGKAQNAIIRTIAAGCSPVRIVESKDGRTIWVTARGDNSILTFDVAKLMSRNTSTVNSSFLGSVSSDGTAPVGMLLFSNGRLLAVVNSNRFNDRDGTSSLVVFDVRSRLPQKKAELNIPPMSDVPSTFHHHDISSPDNGYLSAFPRSVEVGPDDATLFVTKFVASEIMVVNTSVARGP